MKGLIMRATARLLASSRKNRGVLEDNEVRRPGLEADAGSVGLRISNIMNQYCVAFLRPAGSEMRTLEIGRSQRRIA